ncbi:MAG: hypothetical protein WDM78_17535 [Puia sp.]
METIMYPCPKEKMNDKFEELIGTYIQNRSESATILFQRNWR